jgi:hypothetical protein
VSDAPPNQTGKLQPKYARDKTYTDFRYTLSCACIALTFKTSFLLYAEILQKYGKLSFSYFLWVLQLLKFALLAGKCGLNLSTTVAIIGFNSSHS